MSLRGISAGMYGHELLAMPLADIDKRSVAVRAVSPRFMSSADGTRHRSAEFVKLCHALLMLEHHEGVILEELGKSEVCFTYVYSGRNPDVRHFTHQLLPRVSVPGHQTISATLPNHWHVVHGPRHASRLAPPGL